MRAISEPLYQQVLGIALAITNATEAGDAHSSAIAAFCSPRERGQVHFRRTGRSSDVRVSA